MPSPVKRNPRLPKHKNQYTARWLHCRFTPSPCLGSFFLTDEDGGVEVAEPGQQRPAGPADGQGAALHVCGLRGALGLRAGGGRLEPLGRRPLAVPSHRSSPLRPVPSGPAGAPAASTLRRHPGAAMTSPPRRCAEHPGNCSPAAAICSAPGAPGRNHGAQSAAKEGTEPAADRVGTCARSGLVPLKTPQKLRF